MYVLLELRFNKTLQIMIPYALPKVDKPIYYLKWAGIKKCQDINKYRCMNMVIVFIVYFFGRLFAWFVPLVIYFLGHLFTCLFAYFIAGFLGE